MIRKRRILRGKAECLSPEKSGYGRLVTETKNSFLLRGPKFSWFTAIKIWGFYFKEATKMKKTKMKRRVIALLNREEIEYIHQLSMDSLFTTGHKLTKVDIIAALIDAAIKLEVSAKAIKNKQQLTERMLSVAHTMIERRKYPRIKKDLIVNFRPVESLKECATSRTEDLSTDGLRIDITTLEHPPQLNQLLEITIKDPQEEEAVKAIGKIVWIRQKEKEKGFNAGVKLTYIRKEDKLKFIKYLHKELTEERKLK